MQRLQSVETYQIFTGATFLLEPLQFLVFKKRSQILKQTYTWKLQVCLDMYDLLVGARRERVKTMMKMFSWGIQLLRFHKMTKIWTPPPSPLVCTCLILVTPLPLSSERSKLHQTPTTTTTTITQPLSKQ